MITDYIMIVSKRDAERFRRFRMGEDSDAVRALKQSVTSVNAWGLSATSCESIWPMIKCGDRVCFAEHGSRFVVCGIVSSTVLDRRAAVRMWGDTPRMRTLDRLILFSNIFRISEPFKQTCRTAGVVPFEATALQKAKCRIDVTMGSSESPTMEATLPQCSIPIFADENGPPGRAAIMRTGFARDVGKTRQIKMLYNDECQVCGTAIVLPGHNRYSEVHHLCPLKNGGDDDYSNMLVLCPNHHVEFDRMVIGISVDGTTVVDRQGKERGKITMAKGHVINPKNIAYHREAM